MFYILDENKEVVKVNDFMEQAEWMMKQETIHVGDDTINNIRISTIFLGIATNIPNLNDNEPLVFETMTFDKDEKATLIDKYCTWKQAEQGHIDTVEMIKLKAIK